jgi:hypothetical protein
VQTSVSQTVDELVLRGDDEMFNEEAEGSIPGIEPRRMHLKRFLLSRLRTRGDVREG